MHFELLVISFQEKKKGAYCLQNSPLGVSAYVGSQLSASSPSPRPMTSSSQASKTLYVQMTPEYVSSPDLPPGSTEGCHCSVPAIMAHTCTQTHVHRRSTQPYRRTASCHRHRWMDLQGVLLREMSEKDRCCRFHLDVEHKKQNK